MPLPFQTLDGPNPLAPTDRRAVFAEGTASGAPGIHPASDGSTGPPENPSAGGSFAHPHGPMATSLGDPREALGLGIEPNPPGTPVEDLHLSAAAEAVLEGARSGGLSGALPRKPKRADFNQQIDDGQAVTLYQHFNLDQEGDGQVGKDGLIWKAICKTGTLALSPGPGQMDIEQPLNLTPDLFAALQTSVEEQAFPYITVPETHNNGVLENTGYVRQTEVRQSSDPNDESGTKVLWAGIEFTEPEVKRRAENGSIADTSVGVKFNYRNKRTGKTYPAALEHVALTNQPWVDGLTPFGAGAMLSQEPVDFDELETDWRGVYIDWPPKGNILPDAPESGTLPLAMSAAAQPTTVEEVLASHQADLEAKDQRIADLEARLTLSASATQSQGKELHERRVAAKVSQFEGKVPPATLVAAKTIMLADFRPNGTLADEAALNLSVTKDGETTEQKLGPTEIVETLLASLPETESGDTASLILDLDGLTSKKPGNADRDPKKDAEAIDRELHPEAYADEKDGE